ncbi:MAG: NAD(P)/FAD-dependent oxidoreductase [Holosporaceae bacterium]|nr:MAG: NAD(P)/FAD-dependent oxidoreductase [Holosporaceae bacterium]
MRIFTRSETLRLPPWRQKFIKRSKIQPVYKHSLEKVEGIGKKLGLYFEGGKTEEADIVVISMGRIPNSNLFRRKVKMDQKGFIIVDAKTQKTSVPNVYACGDVTDASGPQPQAMIAAGNGMIAGYTIVEDFLKEGVMPSSL